MCDELLIFDDTLIADGLVVGMDSVSIEKTVKEDELVPLLKHVVAKP